MYPPADTSPVAARVQLAALQRLSLGERIRIADESSARLRRMCESSVREQHPNYTDCEVQIAVLRRNLGEECFLRCFPKWSDIRP